MIGAVTLVAESDNWQIEEVVVSPGSQGRGVGSWMLEKLEVLAHNQGFKKLT